MNISENVGLHRCLSNCLGFADETETEAIPEFQEPRHDSTGFEEEGLVQAANNKEQHPTISVKKGQQKSGFSNVVHDSIVLALVFQLSYFFLQRVPSFGFHHFPPKKECQKIAKRNLFLMKRSLN